MICNKQTLQAFEELYAKCKEDNTEFLLFMLLSYDLSAKSMTLVKVLSMLAWFSVEGPYTEACTQNKNLYIELMLCKEYFNEVLVCKDEDIINSFIKIYNSFVNDMKSDKDIWFATEIRRFYKV